MIALKQKLIYLFVILGLVTSSISPACQFIAGKASFVEICTAWGLKKVRTDTDKSTNSVPQCDFCFSNAVQKTLFSSALVFSAELFSYKFVQSFITHKIKLSKNTEQFQARAPPYIS